MPLRLRLLWGILLMLAGLPATAQSLPGGMELALDGFQGRTLRHRSTMVFALPRPARGLRLEASWQTDGSRPWHHLHHLPRLGWSVMMLDYVNPEVLGRAWSLVPFIDAFFLRRERLRLGMRVGFGLGWLDHPYDRLTNPGNNAIGSAINNTTMLSLLGQVRVAPHWWLRAGGTLSHNSNARLQVPNLGLNTAKLRLGLAYAITPDRPVQAAAPLPPARRPVGITLRTGLAYVEEKVPEGPKYPVHVLAAYLDYPLSPKSRLLGGFEAAFDRGIQAFFLDNDIPKGPGNQQPWRYSAIVGHELLIGRVGVMTQTFVYLNDPFSDRDSWGFKLGPQVYLHPPTRQPAANAFLGVYLKAHRAIADYAELVLGVRM
ncbi:MAG: acyloxyacyl hydrolase [Bacteroidetes bacterium]|nr:MAG: acyloxyacyl hydrolase [Bacteroidota bacterium]